MAKIIAMLLLSANLLADSGSIVARRTSTAEGYAHTFYSMDGAKDLYNFLSAKAGIIEVEGPHGVRISRLLGKQIICDRYPLWFKPKQMLYGCDFAKIGGSMVAALSDPSMSFQYTFTGLFGTEGTSSGRMKVTASGEVTGWMPYPFQCASRVCRVEIDEEGNAFPPDGSDQ